MRKSNVSRNVRCAALAIGIGLLTATWLTGANGHVGAQVTNDQNDWLDLALEQDRAQQPAQASQTEKKAEEVYKNIQVLKGIPASRVMGAMTRISGFLGVECTFCHVEGDFEKDEKKPKETARTMFKMVRTIATELGNGKVTCYTCHRGHQEPERMPAELRAQADEANKKAADDKRPVEEAFKNIQSLKGVTAGQLMATMGNFTRSLGVECNFCHVPGAFEKDDKQNKITARKMLAMTGVVAKEYFNGRPRINCYVCHRGRHEPVNMPATPQ